MKNKIKVFLVSYSNKINTEVAKKLKDNSVEILYWIGHGHYFEEILKNKNDFSNTIFHHALDDDILRAVAPEEIDTDNFLPVDRVITDKLLECESLFWMMADRFEDRKELTLRQIKHQYFEYVKYWSGVLKKMKPDFIIFGTDTPHTAFNFVIYSVAKILNIKIIIYKKANGLNPERLIFTNDYKDYTELREAYKKVQDSDFTIDDLSDQMKSLYYEQINPMIDSTPFYQTKSSVLAAAKRSKVTPSLSAVTKNIKSFTLFKTVKLYFEYLFSKRMIFGIGEKIYRYNFQLKIKQYWKNKEMKRLKKNYEELQSEVNFSQKYIYVPLHYQPEMSTSPTGGIYDDQMVMIDNLSSFLPKDWIIYVKENEMQWARPMGHIGRYYNYYKQIADIKNVYLVSPRVSTFDLTSKSQAVATITGTAAFESILRSKPTLVFGYTWFMDCEGVLKINDMNSCKQALEKIASGYIPDQEKIIKYLGVVEQVTVKGFVNDKFEKTADVNVKESVDNIVKKLINMLNKN